MRHNSYLPAEAIVDNVVRKLDFLRDHPGWTIECVNGVWHAQHGDMEYHDHELGLLMDRIEHIADMEES